MIELSVIIPVFNDLKAIKLTVDALRKQTYDKSKFEVIVIDNGSIDGTYEWIKQQPDIVALKEERYLGSPYSARNRGIEIANGEIIALLDSTCVPKLDWVEKGKLCFENNCYDLFGGNVVFDFENEITAGKVYDSITNIQMELSIKEKNATKTANLWVKKYLFSKIGYFREGVRSGEDVGWTSRCTKQGYKLGYCEKCLTYKFARDTKELLKKQFRVGKGQALLWYSQNRYKTMLFKAIRKLLPISPKSMRMLMKRNMNVNYTKVLILKIYLVSYVSGLVTLYGNIVGIKLRKRGA